MTTGSRLMTTGSRLMTSGSRLMTTGSRLMTTGSRLMSEGIFGVSDDSRVTGSNDKLRGTCVKWWSDGEKRALNDTGRVKS